MESDRRSVDLERQTFQKIPEGWISVKLQEIGEWQTGGTPSRSKLEYFDGGIPWVKITDLNDGIVSNTEETISEEGLQNSSAKLLPAGSICVGIYGSIGKIGILGMPATTNQACANCIVNGDVVERKFLFYYIISQRETLLSKGRGGTQPNINNKILREWPISIPPLPEQRRIVARLEALLADSERVRSRLNAVIGTAQRFRQAVLAAAIDGMLTEDWRGGGELEKTQLPSAWSWKSCEEICEKGRTISYGVIKLGQHDESGIPTLRSSDVRHLKIENHHVKKVSREIEANYRRTSLKGGEVLVTVRGTLGGVAAVPPEMRGYNISREVAMVPASATIVDARYLAFAIGSVKSQKWLNETVKGVTYSGINIMDLKRLPILLPPLLEQHEIVRRVDALFALADRIEGEVALALERVEALMQAILAKAFRGELVPTEAEVARREGRAYEPAAVLLERVRAGRAGRLR